jgi:hypothetical protein
MDEWVVCSSAPTPRYGHSQIKLDGDHLLIVGGCGGPNMIFADVWMLTISRQTDTPWTWTEITVCASPVTRSHTRESHRGSSSSMTLPVSFVHDSVSLLQVANPELSAPQLWCHPSCRVGEKLVVLSKPVRSATNAGTTTLHRNMSITKQRNHNGMRSEIGGGGNRGRSANVTNGNVGGFLQPHRRKLLTSRSLDEQVSLILDTIAIDDHLLYLSLQDESTPCGESSSSSCASLNADGDGQPSCSGCF